MAADAGADQMIAPSPRCAVNPRRSMDWTCRRSAYRAGPESLRRVAPSQSRLRRCGRRQADRAIFAAAGGGEPLQNRPGRPAGCREQGGAGVVAQLAPVAVETGRRCGHRSADRAVFAAAGGGEPVAEKHVLADLQAVGEQGGAGVVAQLAPSQSRLAADMGTDQTDRAAPRHGR